MPPYLIALIVGEFTYTEPLLTKDKVSVAVYSRPELLNSMMKARDYAAAILDFFTDYFAVPYPLQKLGLDLCFSKLLIQLRSICEPSIRTKYKLIRFIFYIWCIIYKSLVQWMDHSTFSYHPTLSCNCN